ncbi:hypothetical protein I5M19_08125 [Mucilaginibacter sp. SD-g]|uniref:Uncharacterized protein n=1 Tax=Mucilaginibacter segetis TaxID=2793071 RepID=A0A934UM47_9SPHI|nr:hypothetical protein [Mucilaginibacter segetis]
MMPDWPIQSFHEKIKYRDQEKLAPNHRTNSSPALYPVWAEQVGRGRW